MVLQTKDDMLLCCVFVRCQSVDQLGVQKIEFGTDVQLRRSFRIPQLGGHCDGQLTPLLVC